MIVEDLCFTITFVIVSRYWVYLNTAKTPKLRKDTQRHAKTGKDTQRRAETRKDTQRHAKAAKKTLGS